MKALQEKRAEFEAKQTKLHKVFEQAGSDHDMDKVTELQGDSKAKVLEIRKMNDELTALSKEIEELAAVEKAAADSRQRQDMLSRVKSAVPFPAAGEPAKKDMAPQEFGDLFVKSEAYLKRTPKGGPVSELDVDLKTLFATSAGWAPQAIRTGIVVPYATRPIRVVDIIPMGTTGEAAIVYMEETSFTNPAAEATEGSGAYAEATLALTERTSTVRKIAVWIPVTQEQLEDVAGVQSYLNNRLTFMLRQRLDYQIINGNGTPPNLTGILNVAGIQTFARGAGGNPADQFDAVYRAKKNVSLVGRAEANAFVIHPSDWETLRLMRSNDGIYILGNPNDVGPARIWGMPAIETDAIASGTVLVGDFANFVQLFEKRGIEVDITDSHSDYFIYGKLAIRATMRVALPTFRPLAFCSITAFA